MSASYDLQLLVRSNREDGFGVTRRLNEQIRQKLILLLMTIPGERVMNGDFGVGLSTFLFYTETEWSSGQTSNLTSRIAAQVQEYMSYINIESLDVFVQGESNSLGIRLEYSVPELFDNPADSRVQLEFVATDGQAIDISFRDFHGDLESDEDLYTSPSSGRLGDYFG